MFVVFLSLVFTVVFVCSFFAMHKADLFGGGKIPLALCAAGLAVIGLSNSGGAISSIGIVPTILLPYQVLAIALIGLLLLVLIDRLFFGLSKFRDRYSHRGIRKLSRSNKHLSSSGQLPPKEPFQLDERSQTLERTEETRH